MTAFRLNHYNIWSDGKVRTSDHKGDNGVRWPNSTSMTIRWAHGKVQHMAIPSIFRESIAGLCRTSWGSGAIGDEAVLLPPAPAMKATEEWLNGEDILPELTKQFRPRSWDASDVYLDRSYIEQKTGESCNLPETTKK